MRKGRVRASGGPWEGHLSLSASLAGMRRHQAAPSLDVNSVEEVRELRSAIRHAFKFYLAQKAESTTVPELRRLLKKIRTAARRLVAAPVNEKWAARLYDLLSESNTGIKAPVSEEQLLESVPGTGKRILRKVIYNAVSPDAVLALERALYDERPVFEHLETLHALSALENAAITSTRYSDPALPGLLAVLVPIWERFSGQTVWARPNEHFDDWVSPLQPWLEEVLGDDAPTIDVLNRTIVLQKKRSK